MINRSALNPTFAPVHLQVSRPLCLLVAAVLLLVLQLLSGTGPIYALLVFALLVVSYVAFSWAGGLETLFGICIAYLLLQNVLISQIAKIYFWEAADSGLRQPVTTLGVYVVGMMSLAVGIRLANRFRLRARPLFPPEVQPSRLFWLSVLCTIISTVLALAFHTVGTDAHTGGAIQGGVLGPLKQIFIFRPLAIAAGTAYIIKSSSGRRSFGLLNGFPVVFQIAMAIVSAAREASIDGLLAYVLTCIAFRYRFRPKHYLLLIIAAYIANFIIFPYALIARGVVRTGNFAENVGRSASMIGEIIQNPFTYRKQYDAISSKRSKNLTQFDYFTNPSASLSRYSNIVWVDAIVDATINSGTTGWETITPGFEASLPRFLVPDKSFVQTGNLLAHREPGLMGDKHDKTTGISICFFADAFSCFKWMGISVIPCLMVFCMMMLYRALISDRFWSNVFLLSVLTSTIEPFSEDSISALIQLCIPQFAATIVGLLFLTVSSVALARLTNRLGGVWIANIHPRRQALQRAASNNIIVPR